MRSRLVLLAIVGFACAVRNPGWKDNTEYIYQVNGRTLTSLQGISNQYSGLFLKAKLHVAPRTDGKLQAWISDCEYAQVHSELSDGWNSDIPESQLSYKRLNISKKPFQIISQEGLIKGLIVEKDISHWEANIIKSIVSQLQLDLQGKNSAAPREQREMEAVFKTMEETVTGKTETEYQIHRLPEYLLQSQPWLAPQQQLKGTGHIYEVLKNKNYTNSEDMPAYNFGMGRTMEGKPTGNQMGNYYTRQSTSRVIVSGKISKYTIQSSQTENKILMSPVFSSKEQGSVISSMNLTLSAVKTQTGSEQELENPLQIGNLVYTYETPFADSDAVHQKQQSRDEKYESSEEERSWQRFRRSTQNIEKMQSGRNSDSQEELRQYQNQPAMHEVSAFPLLPYFMAYHGRSIKTSREFDLKQNVQRISYEIAEELQDPEKILSQATLSKYNTLVSLIRLMNEDEIRSVSQNVFNSNQGQQRLAWFVFRDSVAVAGTGPAFLNINEWINTKKIEKSEAADVVSSMAHSVRVPTEEYMDKFFEMIKKPEVKNQEYLNETSLLAYASLLNKVYVNKHFSQNEYPVHSFNSLRTKAGNEFVENTVIPYFAEQLEEAISQADSRKIHMYIRALGHVGHKKILETFEPYLEGQKQVSQFQRLLMVVAMDKLTSSYPTLARSVLYRIYQNAGEIPEIRVVAVYQLMRANPPVEMLQAMAQRTHTDAEEQVNAVVKSAIENASELKNHESQTLRDAAESARPLLTKKQYGFQKSSNLLQDFVLKSMGVELKQNFLRVGSSDYSLPKGIKYSIRGGKHGVQNYFFEVQAMISSIRELTNVLRQTKSEKQESSQWSSPKIAQMLNLQTNEREQLEGFIYAEIGNLHKAWSFDNQSLHQLPELIRQKEQMLRNGKEIQHSKLIQFREVALSFPTEMGLPFLFTYDMPILFHYEGKIQARATPEISQSLNKPKEVEGEMKGFITVSTKVQSRLSVVAPFDHQIYTAGVEKNAQVHLPVNVKVQVNIEQGEAKIEYSMDDKHQQHRVMHYSSRPFTSRSDVMSFTPISLRPNTHFIKTDRSNYKSFDFVNGQKSTGIAIRVWGYQPQQSANMIQLISSWKSEGLEGALQKLFDMSTLQDTEINVGMVSQQTTTRKFVLKLGFQKQYDRQPKSKQSEQFLNLNELSTKIDGRQKLTIEHVKAGINNARSQYLDASIEFSGSKTFKYVAALAYAKSNVAPESRFVAFYKSPRTTMSVEVKGHVKNTNGLDLTASLNAAPKAQFEALYQRSQDGSVATIRADINMKRSEARKQQLQQQPMYQVCKKEMQERNHQLAACQNMTIESNYFDQIEVELKHENIPAQSAWWIEQALNAARAAAYPMVDVKFSEQSEQNKALLKFEFQPTDLKQLNVTLQTQSEETKFIDISLGQWGKTVLVPHPVFHLKSRVAGQLYGQDNIRPTCVIDETAAQTFSNRTYPLSLGDGWTLLMQYVPQQARAGNQRQTSAQQLKSQEQNFAVLAREVSRDHKEVKINFEHPTINGQTVEVYIQQSTQDSTYVVLVDGEQVHFDDNKAAEFYNGYLEIYALENGEVKAEIQNWFYVIYDGERIKLTATTDKLYDSVIGLCGRYTGDQNEDFQTPENCIAKSPQEFLQSYKLENRKAARSCVRKDFPLYVNVVSESDVGKKQEESLKQSGTYFRNRYVEDNGEICFTIHPVPECKTQGKRFISKNIPVYCAQSKTAYYFKSQIDQGGNPDFSHKPQSKTVKLEIPQECY